MTCSRNLLNGGENEGVYDPKKSLRCSITGPWPRMLGGDADRRWRDAHC